VNKEPRATKPSDPFLRLAERFDDPRQVPSLPKILALMLTAREAELLLALPGTFAQIRSRVEARAAELGAVLKKAYRIGVVLKVDAERGEPRYAFPDLYMDNILSDDRNNALGPRYRTLWRRWTREHRARRRFELGPGVRPCCRVLPACHAIEEHNAVLPPADARVIVRASRRRVLQQCACRFRGKDCGMPVNGICLVFDDLADEAVARGFGREVSVKEALAALDRASRAGLVHLSNPDYLTPARSGTEFICNCCPCCCGMLEPYFASGRKLELVIHYRATVDADCCTGCGSCLGRCHFDALSCPDGSTRVAEERCVGCGLCVEECPAGALSLRHRPSRYQAQHVHRHLINPRE
jgi:ferredoxin